MEICEIRDLENLSIEERARRWELHIIDKKPKNALDEMNYYFIPDYLYILRDKMYKNDYDMGIMKMYEYVEKCVINDPDNGGYSKNDIKLIKDAGILLNEYGGKKIMYDSLYELPRRYRNEISMFWDGIGNWTH